MVSQDDVSIEAYLEDEDRRCIRFVPERTIAYFFIRRAADFINAAWTGQLRFSARGVYCHTREGETLRVVDCRSLTQLERMLDSPRFLKIHRTILLNVFYVDGVNPHGKRKEVTLRLSRERQTIFTSGQSLVKLRERKRALSVRRPRASRPTRRDKLPRNRASR